MAFPVGIGVTELADERISGWLDDATLLFVGDLLVVFPHEQERVRVCGVGYEVLESHSGVDDTRTKGSQLLAILTLCESTVLTEQGKLRQSSHELLIGRIVQVRILVDKSLYLLMISRGNCSLDGL